jgi:hypothetical protein
VKQGTEYDREKGEEMSVESPFLWWRKNGNVHGYCELPHSWLLEEKQVSNYPVPLCDLSSLSLVENLYYYFP